MEFWAVIGLVTVFNALYQLGKAYKKTENISKNSLFLGTVTVVLFVEAVDMLTIDWLYNYLGRIYYNRLIGVLFDIILIGLLFRNPTPGLSHREIIVGKLQLLSSAAMFSWYFMYYLCK